MKGSSVEIEDKDKEEVFIIQYNDGKKKNTVTMDKDGMRIEDANGNKITLDQSGAVIEDKNGNVVTMDSSSVTIKSQKIKIGEGAAEKLVLGTTLSTLLTSWHSQLVGHTHVGNLGAPTSPPTPPLNPPNLNNALSANHKVE